MPLMPAFLQDGGTGVQPVACRLAVCTAAGYNPGAAAHQAAAAS